MIKDKKITKNKIREHLNGKVILITGGTGSFGNSVVEKLEEFSPKEIRIFSRDEKKQFDMRNKYNAKHIKFIVGDVRDKYSVRRAMEGVDYVFHAAALKQVPSCEFFPMEAVKTNIIGAHNVLEEAITHKVKRVVILSTDKAVYPINAMGMSKALMEKTMVATARTLNKEKSNSTTLCGVRYGNVLYSRGSVLPYFVEQLKHNKVLTVTNFDMTRFLLPLREAVNLVLYALAFGENGDMYIRKSPACTLETLAEAITRIFNYSKGYKAVGIRAGEKMHETLLAREELIRAVDQGDYYRIPPESQDLDYNKYFFQGDKIKMDQIEAYTSENTERLDVDSTIKLLLTLPEIQEEFKLFATENNQTG